MPYAPCTLDQLTAKGYDYWALGHVHEYGVLRKHPLIVYSGCIQGRHIRETGEKGCVLVDNDSGILTEEFVPLDLLRWMKITVDISGAESIRQVTERFADQLTPKMETLDGRICCARVFLNGRCSIHGRLLTDSAMVTANIRAVAAEISHQKTWIEKVEVNTGPEFNPENLAKSDTPQGELLRYIQELSSNPFLEQELGLDFSQLKSKLTGSGVVVPDKSLKKMLSNARDILLTLLSEDIEEGGNESRK
jgi:DNA repair exonuclease SbcCD nuclease subunit